MSSVLVFVSGHKTFDDDDDITSLHLDACPERMHKLGTTRY